MGSKLESNQFGRPYYYVVLRTDCECVYPRLVSLGNILFQLCDSNLDGRGQKGILLLFNLPLMDNLIVDREGEGECWCSVSRKKFLGKVWNFDDLANVFCDTHLCLIEYE